MASSREPRDADLTVLTSSLEGRVLTLTLNRPERRNALNAELQVALTDALRDADSNPDVGCVVLTGAGSAFCAGGDLASKADSSAAMQHIDRLAFVHLLEALEEIGKPTVARVNGHALAGGMGIALACDIVIASTEAQFGLTEIKLGLWPMMVTPVVVRSLGRRRAMELMLTGTKYPAQKLADWGGINAAVEPSDLDRSVDEIASSIAARSPLTLRIGRRAFNESSDLDYPAALRFLHAHFTALLGSEDVVEGVTAFFEKRDPVWRGR